MGGNDADLEDVDESPWIIETTVLSAFALAGRLDILRDLYGSRAMWTLVVHDELVRGIRSEPRLGDAVIAGWLGEPQPVFDVTRVEELRLRLGGRAENRQHLGEATCIALAEQRGAGVLLDDRDAKRLAETCSLPTRTTISVLKMSVRKGKLSDREASELVANLIDRYGRRLPRLSAEYFSGG